MSIPVNRSCRPLIAVMSAPYAFVAGFLAILLLLGGVSGCGSGQGSATTALRIWYSTDDPVERAWSQQLARRFEAAHPGMQVHLTDLSFEDLNTKLQLALTAGSPPDLAYVTPRGPGIPAYVGAGRLTDLSAAARRDRWASRFRAGLLLSYNRPFNVEGSRARVLAVPMALAAVGVLYNRQLLDRLRLQIPRSSMAFEAALARAKAAGYVPIGMGNQDGWLGDDWYLTLVNAAVSAAALQPEQEHSQTFSFLGPPYLAAAVTLRRWADRGYFTPDFGGLDAQEGIDEFFRGHTLFQLISSSENAQILRDQTQSKLQIGIFGYPRHEGGTVVPYSGYLGWVVPHRSLHTSAAIAFINQILSPSSGRFLLRQGVLPAARTTSTTLTLPTWQRQYVHVLERAHPGVYLDAAPVPSLNATMEENVQLLLQGYEAPSFLVKSLQEVYHGRGGSTSRIDGEF